MNVSLPGNSADRIARATASGVEKIRLTIELLYFTNLKGRL
jgi:hypothetical protein